MPWHRILAVGLAGSALACLAAPTKMGEGFATSVASDGTSFIPRDNVNHVQAGQDVAYWIQWKEPVPRSQLRCTVKGPGTDIDETENFAEGNAEGYSLCGMEGEDSDGGVYTFTQYLDGVQVGERSITVEAQSFFKGGIRKRWKTMMTILGAIVFAGYWIRRWKTGDKRSFKDVLEGEAIKGSVAAPGKGTKAVKGTAAAAVRDAMATGGATAATIANVDIPKVKPQEDPAALLADYKKRLAADPSHRPPTAESAFALAKTARKAGDLATAVAALKGFDKAWPGHALVPEVYLFSAQMMASELANPDMARRIAAHILQKYPGHFVAPEAKRLLATLPAAAS